MPDAFDRKLEELLAYPPPEAPGDDLFVVDVMREVRGQKRRRQVILGVFGGIGAAFGLAGAALLSDAIGGLFAQHISLSALTQLPLLLAGAAAFYAWFMNDDWATGG